MLKNENAKVNDPRRARPLLRFNRQRLFTLCFFGILAFLLYLLLRIMAPFFTAILLAATIALIFYPVHVWIGKKISAGRSVTAGITTCLALATLIIPLLIFSFILYNEVSGIYPKTQHWLSHVISSDTKIPMPAFIEDFIDIPSAAELLEKGLGNVITFIKQSGTSLLKDLFFFIVNLCVMCVCLFFIMRDGDRFFRWLWDIMPLERAFKKRISRQILSTVLAVVRGILLTAVIQGFLAALGYWMFGVPSPALFGFLTAFSALIPFVGTGLVWVPLGIIMLLWKGVLPGVLVLVWGAVVVGLLDNVLRPFIIGKETRLPILLLFMGIVGGIRIYGALGLLLGPLIISSVLIFLQIYKENKNIKDNYIIKDDESDEAGEDNK